MRFLKIWVKHLFMNLSEVFWHTGQVFVCLYYAAVPPQFTGHTKEQCVEILES